MSVRRHSGGPDAVTARTGLLLTRLRDDPMTRWAPLVRVLAFVLAVAVSAIAIAAGPASPARADVVQWGTNGGTAPNYQATVNGDFLTAGNGVLACSAVLSAGSTCAALHSASTTDASSINDYASMQNSNTVSGFTTNSSSAALTVPTGATVVKAFLNWSANTGIRPEDATRNLCATYSSTNTTATLPSGSATGYRTRAVQFQVGAGAIAAVSPDTLLEDTGATSPHYYSATSDVTDRFAGVATGSPISISAGNIWAPTGAGCYAGWSLTVVYDFGTFISGNTLSVPHRVIYYYGHVREGASDQPLIVNFTGFTAVGPGTRLGYTLYEGDRGIVGDTISYSRAGSATYTEVPNSSGATGNIGIGRAVGSVRYTQTQDTSAFTNQSVDVGTAALGNVVAGDSTVGLKVGTSGDSYLLTNATLSVPTAGLKVSTTYTGTTDVQYRTASEKATFTITVTNSGAGTLQNISIADDQADCTRTLTGVTLLPLASTSFTCTATNVTTASYTSTATATGSTVVGGYAASDSDSTSVVLSAIALTKTSALAAGATGRAGDVLTYSFVATNTGGGTLTGVTITDPLSGLGAISPTPGTLTAGQSATATATYTLTQADVDAGTIVNTASTTGTDADGGPKPAATATRTTTIPSNPTLSLAKSGTLPTGSTGKVGDVITYSFTATNTGNVTLTGVTVSDPRPGVSTITVPPAAQWPSGVQGKLLPGQSITETATYTLKQSDIDAGSVKNTATVSGTPPTGSPVSATSNQASVSTAAPAPAIAATKSAAYSSGSGGVGSVITYSFTAKNTGNVTLSGVAITDPHPGLSAITPTATTLAPGQTYSATATYTVTQADVDAGTVQNTATATGSYAGTAYTSTASATLATATAAPALTLTKTGARSGTGAGGTITYTFTVKNTGNVTLTSATVTDPLPGLPAITLPVTTLAPGASTQATATYTIKQSDVDAGSVVNTATATAKPPTGANVSQSSTATVSIPPTPSLTVSKSGTYTSGSGAVGSVVRWDIAFQNTGNVTLSQVALADSLSGLTGLTITWNGTANQLVPGQRATATATYTILQSDVDAGSVTNTATVTGRTPQGASVSQSSTAATVATATAAPAITIQKTGVIAGGAAGNAGDVITYTFTVRNSGNVTLSNVGVTDPLPGLGTITYSQTTLAPGQSAIGTANYTIKQSDVDTGSVKNTATATGRSPSGTTVTGSSGQVTTATAAAAPAIATTKSGALANGATGVAGDTVTWTITLRNSGNQTLTTLGATDSLAGISALSWGGSSTPPASLAPGATATATGTYTLTQADVDAGAVSNIATGAGTSPGGTRVTSQGSATVPIAARGALTVTKTPSIATGAKAGDTITYTFVVLNAGNVTVSTIALTDPLNGLSAITPTPTGRTLAPGASFSGTATYVVKQSDVDTGSIANTATATGKTPSGAAVTPATGSATVTTVAAAPAVTASKSAAYTTGSGAVGSVITYTFTERNTGNVTLTQLGISDVLPGLSALSYGGSATPPSSLAPGATLTATATYTVTQADVDRGYVQNQATATGKPPAGAAVTAQTPVVQTATAASAPALTLTKSGSTPSSNAAGAIVTYSFTLKNTGNVTLTGVGITDPLLTPTTVALPTDPAAWPSGQVGRLRVGDTIAGTATYPLKQSDVNAGSVANTATATATPPTGAAVSTTASATVPISPNGSLAVTKSGAYASGTGGVGSAITWSIGLRNSGNVTLTGISVGDSLAGIGTLAYPGGGTSVDLDPGQTATVTGSYTVKQSDVDAGSVKNTATASGRTPKGVTVTGTSPQASVPTATAAPALSLTKTGAILGGTAGNAGDVIQYTFVLRNTGNVTVTGASITDPLPTLSTPVVVWPTGEPSGTLAPGEQATATARYTIQQADVNAGSVKNTAGASATPPTGGPVTASSGQVTTPTAAANPVIVVTKSGALASGATGVAGDSITWTFTLRNAGNVTLTSTAITDSLPGITAPSPVPTSLQPGQSITATATSTVAQSDVDAGSVANTATGRGTAPSGAVVTSTAPATVSLAARPSISLSKTPSITSGAKAGDTITYTFVARNTGNVTLTGVVISDPLPGLSTGTPGGAGGATLAPGGSSTGTATYTVTQADVDRGSITNTATTSGRAPGGATVTASSGTVTVTTVAAAPSIATSKSAAYTTGSGAVGSVITYTFTATNTGNVTLHGVVITDPLPRLSALTPAQDGTRTLGPGQTATATATYTLTQADLDRGSVQNQATGSGISPAGTTVSSQSAQVTTPTAAAVISARFTKSGAITSGTGSAGSTITYTFSFTNLGNVTLSGVSISDPLISASPISTPGTVAPGATVTATATYTITQTDVDAGAVSNTATAVATPPSGTQGRVTASATVPIAPGAALTLAKSGAYTSGTPGTVGSVITYTFTGTNTGNVTLSSVAIADPHTGLSPVTITSPSNFTGRLAPGAQVVATATYTLRQSDVDAGTIDNTAKISGRTPGGAEVTATSPTVSLAAVTATPAIATTKTATVSGTGAVGDRITYTITARNSGNVTLTGVAISDPMFTPAQIDYAIWPTAAGTLLPGENISASAIRTITQDDVDAGSVTNTASSTGTGPRGSGTVTSSATRTTPTAARAPAIALAQTGALPSGSTGNTGDTVTWSFTITNTGNVTLTSVQVTPQLNGVVGLTYGTWPSGVAQKLLPGQSVTATATSSLTQQQVDAGSVTDPATASGTSPSGVVVPASQPATVSFTPTNAITLSKSGAITSGTGAAGSTITYTFVARNTGATTLDPVAISDPHNGLSPLSYSWPNAPPSNALAPGQQVTATATYTITAQDVQAGSVTNRASVTGRTPGGAIISANSATVTLPTNGQPGLSLAKTSTVGANGSGVTGGLGATVTYSFTARNTGTVQLTNIRIADPLPRLGTIAQPSAPLDPGQTVTVTASYTITQADVDRGYIDNTATAAADSNRGPTSATSNALRTPTVSASPAITLTKTGSTTSGSGLDSTITFRFTVQNTGNVTLGSVAIDDRLAGLGPITPFATTLAPGDSATATATYTVTQADVDAGSVVNTGTASGTPPTGAAATSPPAPATVPVTRSALLTLNKTAAVTGAGNAGSTITYTFTARNAGTVTLRGVVINDPLPGLGTIGYGTWPSGTDGLLRPGDSIVATATYPVKQADVDRGSVTNQAIADATLPDGTAASRATSPSVTTPLAAAQPRLAVTKSASITSGARVGDVIRYTIQVANTGNVGFTGISVTDPTVTDLAVSWPGATGTLAPGQTATGTASYRVTQQDVDAGSVVNAATAAGTPVRGAAPAPVSGSATTTTTVPSPAIGVTDSGRLLATGTNRAGDTVRFTYVITNTGNVTLHGVAATEALGSAPIYGPWPGGTGTDNILAPGQSVTVTSGYTLKQADVDAGFVRSDVIANGTGPAPASTAVTATANATVAIPRSPSLSPVKTGTIVSPGVGNVGDTVRYTLDVTNTGNVTLYQGALVDPLPGLRIISIVWPDNSEQGKGVLPPGTTVHGVGEYTLTQADLDLGSIQNTAHTSAYTTETGQDPANVVTADSNTVTIATAQAAPALTVTKSGRARAGNGPGGLIDWTVQVTNSGNVTMNGIQITDALALQNTSTPATSLAPGASTTLTGTTTITQSDVDAGAVTNTAAVTGTPIRGPASVSAGPASATVPTSTRAPAISVTKTAALDAGSTGVAGDLVDFSYTVTNSGNTTLTGVQLTESLSTLTPIAATGTLLPGQSATVTAQHRLTQQEVDAGGVSSPVTATGVPPASTGVAQVSASATAGVTVTARPNMAVTKSGAVGGAGAVGDTISYSFTIQNTGNVTLSLVDLADSLQGVTMPVIDWAGGPTGILGPNKTVTATASYTIRQADVDRGSVGNTATASGKPPVGNTIFVSSPLTTTTVGAANPGLTVTKTASPSTGLRVGDTTTFTITATNSGNVSLTGVGVTDPLSGLGALTPQWPGTAGTLAPTQAATWTGDYRVTQSDVDAGSVGNTATVSADPPRGARLTLSASVTATTATPGPSIRVTDAGALAPGSTGAPGDPVTWTYVVTNTGNVTLHGIALTEALSSSGGTVPVFAGGTPATLAPGASATATSTYPLKQADIDAGTIASSVNVSGLPPTGAAVTSSAAASVTIPRTATFTVVKSAQLVDGPDGAVGQRIRYQLDVQNTGNVTLYRGQLLDPLPGLGTQFPSWPNPADPGVLPPGTGATGFAYYPITQGDVDNGSRDNVATVQFNTTRNAGDPGDTPVVVPSNRVVVNLAQAAPQLTVTKTGVPSGSAGVGDAITWTVTVRNTGNVTVNAVQIQDDLPITITQGTATPGPLAPGQTAVLTGTSPIAQGDVDAGSVTNTARATGTSARDGAAVTSPDAVATVRTQASGPQIDLQKTATKDAGWNDRAGNTVTFGYTVTNTGNTTLRGVTVADPLVPAGSIVVPGTLAPGQRATATTAYTVTQADVDRGFVSSVATATGTPPTGSAVTDSDGPTVPIAQTPDMAVTKVGTLRGSGGVRDHVDYAFTITNTGNVTLTLVDLADQLAGVTVPDVQWQTPQHTLVPGQRVSATASYEITQGDVDRGTVGNTAVATGKPPIGDTITRSSNTSVTAVATAAPALTVTKTATPTTGLTAGTTISYGIRIANSGNVTVSGITATDALPGLTGFTLSWPGATGVLAPGQAATATPTYRVTQDDIDRGSVANTVSAAGQSPSGASVGDSASVTSIAAPAVTRISVTDSGALEPGSTGAAGDTVTFSYVVTNTGTVTLHGVALAETLGVTAAPVPPTAVLAPGRSTTATATYTLTQDDVDRGTVTSRITATGLSPSATAADATDTSSATVTIPQTRGLSAVKAGTIVAPGVGNVGDTVHYTLDVTNTGNVTVYQGKLVDPLSGLIITSIVWPNPAQEGTLPPGTTVHGEGSYQLKQEDIDRGYLQNTATVEAFTTPTDRDPANRVPASSNTVVLPTAQAAPQLTITKTATRTGTGAVGDTIDYTIVTQNTGNVTVNGVALAEQAGVPAPVPSSLGALKPGDTATSTTSYRITQADVDAGAVANTATASGTSIRDGAPVTATSNTTSTPTAARAPAITIADVGALPSGDNRAGGTVTWTYTVKNTGNTTLTGIALSDALPNVGAPSALPSRLAPGESAVATATYTLTQDDVDAGSVISRPTVTGQPPVGALASASTTATVSVQAAPQFAITKTAELQTPGRNGVGDTVIFRFTLSNGGNTTLHGVTLTDTLNGLSTPQIDWPTATDGVLPPGTSATATATYQIAQKDLDAGSVQNQANATALPPTGPAIPAQSSTAIIPTAAASPGMALTKGGSLLTGSGAAGSVVRFTFSLRNTGNVTLSALSLADALTGPPTLVLPGGGTTLIPGAVATATVDYTLTQADVDRGYVDNVASATSTPARGATFTVPSNTFRFATATPAPAIRTTLTGALEAGQTGVLGDTIDYVVTVTNPGNVTLHGVTIANTVGGLTQLVYTWPAGSPDGTIPPGRSATLTAKHIVTQDDVDAGVIRNTASATGLSPSNVTVRDAAPEVVVPLQAATNDLTLSKVGTPAGGGLGDTILYTLVLSNAGTSTLTDARITDGLPGLSTLQYGAWPTGTAGTLPPNTSVTATATYVVTQQDLDQGYVANTASGSARTPGGPRTTAVSPATRVATAAAAPAITIAKTARLAPGSTGRVGDTVLYSFTVRNTGNLTLDGVALTDDQAGITGWTYAWPGTPGELAPGQELTATARYTLTQTDVDSGQLTSTARTAGTGDQGPTVTADQPVSLAIAAAPALSVVKTATPQGTPTVGSTIGYSIVVTNAGNVTLTGLTLADPLLPGLTAVATRLLPGESTTATGTYTVTQADVDGGAVANTATASGIDPHATSVAAQGSATVQVPNGAAISLTMGVRIADGQRGFAGDTLLWSWVISNTGGRTLTGITLFDPPPGVGPVVFGPWPSGTAGTLGPGQSVTASASSIITAAQQGKRVVGSSTVTAVGASAAQRVEDDASAAVQLPAVPVPGRPGRPGGGLAATGVDTDLPAGMAIALVLWGLVLVGAAGARRRKETR